MIKLKKLIKELRLKKLEDLFHGIDYGNHWESLSDVSPKAKQLTTKIKKTKKNMIDLVKALDDEIVKRTK
jgi:hypothetical protein